MPDGLSASGMTALQAKALNSSQRDEIDPHSVRFAATSPPLDGGEEAPAAAASALPLPF
jgi:hypothetical protein